MKKRRNIFKVKDLNFWYSNGNTHALKNINLVIKENEIMSLIGPSGCGKSTFIRCLNRMNNLVEGTKMTGSIMLDNRYQLLKEPLPFYKKFYKDFKKKQAKKKKQSTTIKTNHHSKIVKPKKKKRHSIKDTVLRTRVGLIFQTANPFDMSIYENVAFGPRLAGISNKAKLDEIVQQSLQDAALWKQTKDRLNDPAFSLSGGQKQRLCIARAIAMNPEILLMDEPTASLDPIATAKIEKLITKLKEKFSIVIVTHSMQQALRISDRTAFFYMGELIESGETKKIFNSPAEKITHDYISGKMG
ncbi:phosphate ABC transporter ATP-binding protein [Candidatus Mycoplasma mahonii]|uniref:phosphate ABC transporter ATP-binding protein n=1 Tax=Candidatus Mycoplasma mahonii TaxID=3004105 RepID=UPI0026EA5ECD|nr:phosphate ABC transporter ATP-binding protein [Candidatus Mycoplasma mahonii]WKX02443.1 phosphate ABC transporter ATP-binding protein [Candidatus Mycoplasma mahonii]